MTGKLRAIRRVKEEHEIFIQVIFFQVEHFSVCRLRETLNSGVQHWTRLSVDPASLDGVEKRWVLLRER